MGQGEKQFSLPIFLSVNRKPKKVKYGISFHNWMKDYNQHGSYKISIEWHSLYMGHFYTTGKRQESPNWRQDS